MITNEQYVKITEEFGTPLYIYERSIIERQFAKLTNAFAGSKTRFFYACKALSNMNILKIIHQLGAGLDTVSINEVKIGLKAGFAPKQILFTPNCVHFSEIEEAKELASVAVIIDFDSLLLNNNKTKSLNKDE